MRDANVSGPAGPGVSVIVCTRNRANRLAETLSSLAGMCVDPEIDWELVVVDNGSTDETAAIVASFQDCLPLHCVSEEKMGLSHARNRGVNVARGDVIVWIDDDVSVAEGWIDAWYAGFRAFPDADFFGAEISVRFDEDPPAWVLAGWSRLSSLFAERRLPAHGAPIEADYLPFGANFAVRARVQRSHSFDPTLGRKGSGVAGGEETTMLTHLIEEGHEGRWIQGAGVLHLLGAERYDLGRLRRQIRSGAGLLQSEPRDNRTGAPLSTDAIWRLWLKHELGWRANRLVSTPERWVDDFVAAASWRGLLDRRRGRRFE